MKEPSIIMYDCGYNVIQQGSVISVYDAIEERCIYEYYDRDFDMYHINSLLRRLFLTDEFTKRQKRWLINKLLEAETSIRGLGGFDRRGYKIRFLLAWIFDSMSYISPDQMKLYRFARNICNVKIKCGQHEAPPRKYEEIDKLTTEMDKLIFKKFEDLNRDDDESRYNQLFAMLEENHRRSKALRTGA